MEPGASFEAALEALKGRIGRRRRRARAVARLYVAAVGAWAVVYTACFLMFKTARHYPLTLVVAATALAAGAIVAHICTQARLNAEEVGAAAELSGYEDPRVLGELLEELRLWDCDTRPLVVRTLTRLLPRLQPADADRLTGAQRACLYGALGQAAETTSEAHDVTFALAVLEALVRIGDRRALRTVRRLAWEEGRDERIRAGARECLPRLEARLQQRRETERLLRPADAAPDVLLRPAAQRDPIPPEQLLRPPPE